MNPPSPAPEPTPAEAREIMRRFCASHFHRHDVEHARTNIPATPQDDDLRMAAFIDWAESLATRSPAPTLADAAVRYDDPFNPKTGQAIADMINAFLRWKLPESVCSDRCVTRQGKGRTGTNLLTMPEAMEMIQEVVCPIIARHLVPAIASQSAQDIKP